MRDYWLYIKDMLAAIDSIESFVAWMSSLFKRMIRPPARLLESWRSLGEAAKQFPESIRQKYPQVPWTEMAGMRDRLIHAYFGVDYKLVWKTIT